MATIIPKPTAPNLPFAPAEYSSQYGEQLNNVLRLYFNQLTSAIGSLSTTVNGIEAQIVVLQTEVADLQGQVASAQTLIWLDM